MGNIVSRALLTLSPHVTPAKAGAHLADEVWTPAFAGVTAKVAWPQRRVSN